MRAKRQTHPREKQRRWGNQGPEGQETSLLWAPFPPCYTHFSSLYFTVSNGKGANDKASWETGPIQVAEQLGLFSKEMLAGPPPLDKPTAAVGYMAPET